MRLGADLSALADALAPEMFFYRNPGTREQPGQARIVVGIPGTPGRGQVMFSQEYMLRLAATPRVIPADATTTEAITELFTREVLFEMAEVGIFGRIYRTWKRPEMSEEQHVMEATLVLIDASVDRVKSVQIEA